MAGSQKVFLRIVGIIGDGSDPDEMPDRVNVSGSGRLVPTIAAGAGDIAQGPDSLHEIRLIEPVPFEIIDGMLTYDGKPYVWLPVPTGEWMWRITFDQVRVGERLRELRDFLFPLDAATEAQAEDQGYPGINLAQYSIGSWAPGTVNLTAEAIQQITIYLGRASNAAGDAEQSRQIVQQLVTDHTEHTDQVTADLAQTISTFQTQLGITHDHIHLDVENAGTHAAAADEASATATTKASEANTSAGIATTKAGEAQGFRNEAEGFNSAASTQAGIATTKAEEAGGFRNEAEGFKNDASTQAGIATTKAEEAGGFRNEAEGFKNQALAARLSWKGAWDSGTAYIERDVVSHGGSSWWAKQPSTGVEPAEGATWSLVASKGEQGEGITSAADLTGALTNQVDVGAAMADVDLSPVGGPASQLGDVSAWLSSLYVAVSQAVDGLSTKADLDGGGKLAAAQLPALAITEFLGTPASQSAMLALSGQRGDWCVRTDRGTQWILVSDNPAVIGSWREMVTPAAPVSSVAGRTGAVTLSKSDVGLSAVDNTSDLNKPISTAVSSALGTKAASDHTHSEFARVAAAPATWHWSGTSLPTAVGQVHAQARVGDFIVAPNLTTNPGWHQITGV